MSFDGIFLSKLKKELDVLKTGRISKIFESGDTDFLMQIRSEHINYSLMLSFSADYSRIHITNKQYDFPKCPKNLTMFLRKHIEGYIIKDIHQYESDRIIYFILSGYNDMQDYNEKILICEIMGRYSNLILTDSNFKILESLVHNFQSENTRTIVPNAIYEFPKSNKINPLLLSLSELNDLISDKKINTPKDFTDIFLGASMQLASTLYLSDNISTTFYKYIHENFYPSTFYNQKQKLDFYYFNGFFPALKNYESLSLLLDDFYYELDKSSKIKAKTDDLLNFSNKQIKKLSDKVQKLKTELSLANDADIYKLYGELLLSIDDKNVINSSNISVLNYYDNTYVNILLDPKLNVIDNSQKYFKKYRKAKNSIVHINNQIALCYDEIEYFKIIKTQIETGNLLDILDIIDELVEEKYLPNKNSIVKKRKPILLSYIVDENTTILVGKNNLQNDYLTNTVALPNELWFHVKDGPGAHVLLRTTNEITELYIRSAANIAAYYSYAKDSSSVPVNYTLAKNIKKIKGKRNCFVSIKNEKTIYIDPNIIQIESLKVKK